MGLRDVRELIASYEGLSNCSHRDDRATRLTVGDLRLLLHCAIAVIDQAHEPRLWTTMLNYEASDAVNRAD
jgi:hypothetical protein